MNKHNERAELIKDLRNLADLIWKSPYWHYQETVKKAAAMLEAQPMKPLTEGQIFKIRQETGGNQAQPPAQPAREWTEPQMAEIALQLMELRGVERLVWGDMASVAQGRLLTPNAESKLRGKNAGL